jgi:outer membrane protein assembly factor BamB
MILMAMSLLVHVSGCGSPAGGPSALEPSVAPSTTTASSDKPARPTAASDELALVPDPTAVVDTQATVGAPPGAGGDWPVWRGDDLATGVARDNLPEQLDVVWKFHSNMHGFEATAAIHDGLVYAGSLDGELYVLSLADGTLRWKHHTELGFNAPPAVAGGRVFAGDADGRFYCLEAATGKPLWGFETGAEIDSGPNFYKDWVLFGSQDATLYCLEQATGKLVWKYTIGDQVRCSPTIVESRAFLAGCDAKLHIIDVEKGAAIAAVEIDGATGSTPAVGGDCVFFGTEGPSFFAVNWRNAKIAWQLKPGRNLPIRGSAAVTPEAVIFGGHDKHVYAVDPETGKEIWSFATRAKIDGSPVVVGQRVFVGSGDGRLYALDRASGKPVWDYEAGGHFVASPAVADGRLVIGNTDGTLYCFGAK